MPFTLVLNADRSFKSADEIVRVFESVGDLEDPKDQPVVVSC